MEKFYKRLSNYIKTCSTTPNTGKFARIKGWTKKHKCSIACDHKNRAIYRQDQIKFRENLPNSEKFRGPTQSGRSQGGQR